MPASRVRFNRVAKVMLIPSIAEMSSSEIEASYFSDQEFNEMQADTVRTIRAMRRSQPLKEKKYSARGLEQLKSPARLEQTKSNRNNVISAVLDEQERQWARGTIEGEEEIAKASRSHSKWAREMALAMGASDAAWVRSMVRNLRQADQRDHLASVLSQAKITLEEKRKERTSSSFLEKKKSAAAKSVTNLTVYETNENNWGAYNNYQ